MFPIRKLQLRHQVEFVRLYRYLHKSCHIIMYIPMCIDMYMYISLYIIHVSLTYVDILYYYFTPITALFRSVLIYPRSSHVILHDP